MDTVSDKVKKLLQDKLGIADTAITPEANLLKDLGIDSLDFAELVMEFEHEFNIKIPDQDAEKLQTISDVESYISNKLK